MEFYRTFIALPVTVGEEVHRTLEILKQSLNNERISWVPPDRYHLTLRFLGDTPLNRVEAIAGELIKRLHSPLIHMQFTSLDSFGPRKRPRVIWIGFQESKLLRKLFQDTGRVLDSCGIPPPDQPFTPHLTLGRVRSLKEPERFYQVLDELKESELGGVEIDRLIYYRSILGNSGPVYTSLCQVEFDD
jgi:2'-5' RNA ligase